MTLARRLSVFALALMAALAGLGLAAPGLYRDQGFVAATWFGNDLVTLALATPLFGVALVLDGRGSPRGRLVWLGALGYGVYNTAFYLLGATLNALFPLYAALTLLFAAALGVLLRAVDPARFASAAAQPRARGAGAYFLFCSAGLSVVWLSMWFAHVFSGRALPIDRDAFRLVAALDLTLMVPLMAAAGVLLVRRRAEGVVIGVLAGVQASLYLTVLAVNAAIFVARGLAPAPGELPVWGTLAIATTVATISLLSTAGSGAPER